MTTIQYLKHPLYGKLKLISKFYTNGNSVARVVKRIVAASGNRKLDKSDTLKYKYFDCCYTDGHKRRVVDEDHADFKDIISESKITFTKRL